MTLVDFFQPFALTDTLKEDVQDLVSLSERIARERKERIREIQFEREELERPRPIIKQLAAAPWDEERVYEKEVFYDRGPPPRRYR